MSNKDHSKSRLSKLIGSRATFIIFCAVFIFLAGRIAFTRIYPLPFDEAFHFGLIKLYTHHLNPFLATQPAGANAFGAVARNPSYLYHYLMSFPLRVIGLFAHSTIQQVIALRVIDIGFGVLSLVLLRKLARRLGASAALANLAVLAMAVTPVFYDVSGQINYDDLMIPLAILSLLGALSVISAIKRGHVPSVKLGLLLALILLTSLVKYAFLPIMTGIFVYIASLLIIRSFRKDLQWNVPWKSWSVGLTVLAVLASSGLWLQRYGVNLVAYHTPAPQCSAVLNVSACSQYGAWYRNYMLQQTYAQHPVQGLEIVGFTKSWAHSMYDRAYSLVSGKPGAVVFTPISAVVIFAKFIMAAAFLYGLVRWRKVKGSIPWAFFGLIVFGYIAAIWAQNFIDFHRLGAFVGIQGRYMLLILPIIYATMARLYTFLAQDARAIYQRTLISNEALYPETDELLSRRTKTAQYVAYNIRRVTGFRTSS